MNQITSLLKVPECLPGSFTVKSVILTAVAHSCPSSTAPHLALASLLFPDRTVPTPTHPLGLALGLHSWNFHHVVSWLVSLSLTHTHTHTPSLQGNSLCSHFVSFPLSLTNPLPCYILQHVSPLEICLCFSLLSLQPSPQERQDFVSFTACFVGLSRRGEAFLHVNTYLFIWLHRVVLAAPCWMSCELRFGTWDLVPWPGVKPRPLHWEHGVRGPPGKPPFTAFVFFGLAAWMDLDGTQWVYSNYVLIFVEFECLFSPVDWNPSKTEALFIFPYTKHSQHPGVSVSCGQRHVDVDMTYSKFSVRVMVVFFFSPKESLHIKSYIELHKEVNVNLLTFFCLFFSSGPNRGHYITIVKSHGFWLLFDDDIVEVGMQMIISEGGGAETVFWDVCMWTFSKIGLYSCHLTWKQLTFLSELHSAAPYPLWKRRRGVIMDPSVLCFC